MLVGIPQFESANILALAVERINSFVHTEKSPLIPLQQPLDVLKCRYVAVRPFAFYYAIFHQHQSGT